MHLAGVHADFEQPGFPPKARGNDDLEPLVPLSPFKVPADGGNDDFGLPCFAATPRRLSALSPLSSVLCPQSSASAVLCSSARLLAALRLDRRADLGADTAPAAQAGIDTNRGLSRGSFLPDKSRATQFIQAAIAQIAGLIHLEHHRLLLARQPTFKERARALGNEHRHSGFAHGFLDLLKDLPGLFHLQRIHRENPLHTAPFHQLFQTHLGWRPCPRR